VAKTGAKRKFAQSSKKRQSARPDRRDHKAQKRNTTGLVPFAKGNPGKPKGAKNKLGVRLKEAILEAAERSGRDGKGKDGAVGYLVWLSRAEPAVFGRMLEKVMPLQVDVRDKTERTLSAMEAVEKLEERGLPVPPSLRQLAKGIAERQAAVDDAKYDAELSGEGYEGAGEDDVFSSERDAVGESDDDDDDDGSTGGAPLAA
jgi:hypothetical protein